MTNRQFGLLLGLSLILFTFQNCGRSGFETAGEDDLLSVSGVTPTSKDSTPIAFEVGLDTIAYNSCVPSVRTTPGYSTIRATAGGARGGARLTPQFMASAASQLVPILGNPQVLDVQYKQLIETTNPGAEAQAAFRSISDLQAVYTGTAPDGIWGKMDYLSHDSWLTPLVDSARRQNNAFVGYSARAPSQSARFDFKFSQDFGSGTDYWSGLLGIQGFKSCVVNGCQGFGRFNLAVGFSEPSNKKLIRGPAANSAAQVYAYGRGYRLDFGHPRDPTSTNPNQVFTSHGARAVKGILEYDLRTQNPISDGATPNSWSCFEIPIMSPNNRGPTSDPQTSALDDVKGFVIDPVTGLPTTQPLPRQNLCNPMQGNFAVGNFTALRLEKVREILPAANWQLGFQNINGSSRLCAIPTGFDCYPTEAYQRFVNGVAQPYPYYVSYTPGEACINEENLAVELTKTGDAALDRVCGHYVSVCIKN